MDVAVIGAGYVGLVQAAGLAMLGHRVKVGEANPERLELLRQGKSPIFEPGLDELIADGIASDLLSFHSDNKEAAAAAEVLFIAVPTPDYGDGSADLRIVHHVIEEIAPVLPVGAVIAFKSTVPIGTVSRIEAELRHQGYQLSVVSNPEFLREASAVADFSKPDRVVVGSHNRQAAQIVADLYHDLRAPMLLTDPASSEMVKYGSNAYLATRITFANAIANLCEAVGADVRDVLLGMGYDRRIGFHFMNPGPGYGGSCFPKDTKALVSVASESGYEFSLLEGVIAVNELQRRRIVDKIMAALDGYGSDPKVGVWGLAFKAGTDDLRDSPAVDVINALLAKGISVRAYDPQIPELAGVIPASSPLEAVRGVDALLIATEWPEFQEVELTEVRSAMRGDAIIDARNLLDPARVRELGLRYWGVGR